MSKLSNTVFRAFFLPLAALLLPAVAPALPQGDSPATEPAVQTVADSVSVTRGSGDAASDAGQADEEAGLNVSYENFSELNHGQMLAASLLVVALALVVDVAFATIQRLASPARFR